jgi:allantoinase
VTHPTGAAARLTITSTRVLVDGEATPAAVVVEDGVIAGVTDRPDGGVVHDHGDALIMPALVDTHVHVNEPGRSEWEGFATATRAAAAGGVSIIIDMPLNSIPATVDAGALRIKREAAAGNAFVDVGFWGGIVPGNGGEIDGLVAAGVFGFKAFLVESGVDEFPPIPVAGLGPALRATGGHGVPLLLHAESPGVIDRSPASGPSYDSYLASRPAEAEVEAVAAVIAAVEETGSAAHILHLSAAEAVAPIAAARARGLPVTVETCPHYLALTAEEVPDGDCAWKCAPPIRDARNRDLLWSALRSGDIDMVVSDHSPCPGEMKAGGFDAAWGGIASLELRLPVVWTEARRRGHTVADVAEWLCAAPARLAGLDAGTLAPGARADLVVWEPDETFVVDPQRLQQRHRITPYRGRELSGVVRSTYVRGTRVFSDGTVTDEANGGLLRR